MGTANLKTAATDRTEIDPQRSSLLQKTPAAETTEPHPAPGLAAVSLPKGVLSPFPRFSFFEYPASRHEHPLQTGVLADDNALIGISLRSL